VTHPNTSDVSRGWVDDATRQWYGSTGAWVRDVSGRAWSTTPQNGRTWAATTQVHNGTWVNGDDGRRSLVDYIDKRTAGQEHWSKKRTGQTEINTGLMSDELSSSDKNIYQRASESRSTNPEGGTDYHWTAMTDTQWWIQQKSR